jgi:CheY-like chemotaxis protein
MTNNLPQLTHPDGSPIRALVVDDEPSLAELMSMGLRMAGWSVAVAGDGPAAVKLAKDFRPDVLVLDVMLPGFDGVELLGRIRAFAPEVPALFLTAKDDVQDRIVGPGRRRRRLCHQALQHGGSPAAPAPPGPAFRGGRDGHGRTGCRRLGPERGHP